MLLNEVGAQSFLDKKDQSKDKEGEGPWNRLIGNDIEKECGMRNSLPNNRVRIGILIASLIAGVLLAIFSILTTPH